MIDFAVLQVFLVTPGEGVVVIKKIIRIDL